MIKFRSMMLGGFTIIAVFSASSFALESSQTLPKGISRIRNVDIFARTVTNSFDSDGQRNPVASPMFKTIKASEIISAGLASDPNNEDYKNLQALHVGLNNLDPAQDLGEFFQVQVTGNAEIDARRYFVGYEYGITDSLSVGFSLPIVQYDVQASISAKMSSNTESLKNLSLVQAAKMEAQLDKVDSRSNDIEEAVLSTAFDKRGYQRPRSFSYTAVGELELGIKKNWLEKRHHGLSTQLSVRLPTASRNKDYRNILDPGAGDNQTDAYLVGAYDLKPTDNLRIGNSLRYTLQLPDSEYMPVRYKGETLLPDLNDPYVWESVNRNLGDSIDYEFVIGYLFWKKRFQVTNIYAYHRKELDSISGSKDLDYSAISANTNKSFHTMELGLEYSTVHDVLRTGSGVPATVRVAYNDTFKGTNTFDASYYRLDLVVFFK